MKLNKKISRMGLAFMAVAIFNQFDASWGYVILFCAAEAIYLWFGGLSDREEQ